MISFTKPVPRRRAVAYAGLAALAIALSACGRAGPLEPPPDASATAKPSDSSAASGEPQVHKKIPPITAPKTPFVLDPLL